MSGYFFNFIGGTARFIFGRLFGIFTPNQKKYNFNEYINGPKDGDVIFDSVGHEFNNKIIGLCCIVAISIFLAKC